ncbi:flagellar export protein FliJ [Neokomagataea tanensis]|uniref:Flagellar export protein FliJ n=2 Tax=Neokomagataea TaxID=1223423 RepID=A0A4Y6V4M4_9PROT|nr:flagellar export protein FliJ [Neokomagataea tanensis]
MEQATLDALYAVRKNELESVEQVFREVVGLEQEAECALVAAQQRIVTERNAAIDAQSDDQAVEAFSAWLPSGQKAVREAEAQRQRIGMDRDCVHAALLDAQAALSVVERLQEDAVEEHKRKALKVEQILLDECAMRPKLTS